jgi:hypothetical protein
MITTRLEKKDWKGYFDLFTSRHLKNQIPELARIEVLSADMGAQIETSRERLLGVTYDSKDDSLEFEFEGFVHRVYHPQAVLVVEEEKGCMTRLKVIVDKLDMKLCRGREEILSLSHALGHQRLLEAPAAR